MIRPKPTQVDIPHQYDINVLNSFLEAMRQLGGSASGSQVVQKVGQLLNLSQDQLDVKKYPTDPHTIFDWRIRWTRWILDKYGLTEIITRGTWQLTERGWSQPLITDQIRQDILKVRDDYLSEHKRKKSQTQPSQTQDQTQVEDDYLPGESWKDKLLDRLQSMNPYSFENFCKNFLSKLGLESVEVTSRSADGGIDGFGIIKVNGVIGFKMAYQCKRYSGSVGAPDIQKFRGATSQFEKTLFITTGSFTQAAKKEAEVFPRIDLVDGDTLADKMADLGLGVLKDQIVVDYDYFAKFEASVARDQGQ